MAPMIRSIIDPIMQQIQNDTLTRIQKSQQQCFDGTVAHILLQCPQCTVYSDSSESMCT